MYCYSGFSRRYIGIEISIPIPMYGGSNLSIIYIGMGQYRPVPMYRQKLPKQNTSEIQVFFQSRCISINFPRFYPFSLAAYSRASRQNKQNTSESGNLWQSRCIPINFPRIYLLALAAYSRASQPHLISRASRQKNNSYTNFTLSAPKRALRASASALPLTVILRGSSFLSLPSTM